MTDNPYKIRLEDGSEGLALVEEGGQLSVINPHEVQEVKFDEGPIAKASRIYVAVNDDPGAQPEGWIEITCAGCGLKGRMSPEAAAELLGTVDLRVLAQGPLCGDCQQRILPHLTSYLDGGDDE